MHKPLSDRQKNMLQYMNDYVETKNYPPSIREIGEAVELKLSSTVKGHLDRLKVRGYSTGKKESRGRCGSLKKSNLRNKKSWLMLVLF